MRLPLASAALLAALSTPSLGAIEVQFAPGADATPYRKVHIASAQVEFHREFLAEAKSSRNPSLRLRPEEIRELALDMGEGFTRALADAFKRRGFEVVPAPAGDVLRISPALKNLYVNAPDAPTAAMTRSYVREAGGAMMVAEASNSAGTRMASASEESTTSRSHTFEPASRITNRFWFGAMFRAWADDFAGAIAARR